MMKHSYLANSMRIYAQRTHWGSIEVRFSCQTVPGNKTACAKQLEFEEVEPGTWIEPAMVLGHDEAQQLIDELWRNGLRPTEGAGSAGQLASTERHLEDMHAIAFHKLGVPKAEK